jgi:hypothetical protein
MLTKNYLFSLKHTTYCHCTEGQYNPLKTNEKRESGIGCSPLIWKKSRGRCVMALHAHNCASHADATPTLRSRTTYFQACHTCILDARCVCCVLFSVLRVSDCSSKHILGTLPSSHTFSPQSSLPLPTMVKDSFQHAHFTIVAAPPSPLPLPSSSPSPLFLSGV